MSEPMIPKSMHDSAVEAARSFGRQEAEREALAFIARLVEAAGGEIRLTRRAILNDPPELFRSQSPLSDVDIYQTKRHMASGMASFDHFKHV